MKKLMGAAVLTEIVLLLGFILHAKPRNYSAQSTYSEKMQLVSPEKVPFAGTFYLLSSQLDGSGKMNKQPLPPLPYDPYGNKLPIYTFDFSRSEFLVADSSEDYKGAPSIEQDDERIPRGRFRK